LEAVHNGIGGVQYSTFQARPKGNPLQVFFVQRGHARKLEPEHRLGKKAGRLGAQRSSSRSNLRPGLEGSQRISVDRNIWAEI
jgi:hypothetical protein